MDADRRLVKALEAASDALQHLSLSPDFATLDCTHIDRLLARVVDLPTEGNQRNSRRNLLVIRQWMITEGPSVVLLEVLGQLYWRLGELNGKQFEKFKASLQTQQPYLTLIQDPAAVSVVVQRIRHIQKSKSDACHHFLCELSDLTGLKAVDSPMADIERLRATSTSPFTTSALSTRSLESTSSQETGYIGLIKYVPTPIPWNEDMEDLLLDFYINGICPGRTLATTSNTYLSLVGVAERSLSTRYAILSMSASYLTEYFSSEKENYRQAELYYANQAIQDLSRQIATGEDNDAVLATSMLLAHHDAVNNTENAHMCWSCHANVFDLLPPEKINHQLEAALFMRFQIALARTAQTSQKFRNTPVHGLRSSSWYGGIPPADTQRIMDTIGLSPQLLFNISSITSLAAEESPTMQPHKLMYSQLEEAQLQNLKQWTAETPGDAQEVILATAEAFRLAALIYLRCRLYGFTRFHPAVVELNEALIQLLLSIPVKGPLFTAIYPLWPLFIAAVTANSDQRDLLYQRVVPIREGDKSTLPLALKRVSGLRVWLARQDPSQHTREGWWDEMLEPSSSTWPVANHLILCLG